MNKKSQVEKLFQEIYNTNICGIDTQKVKRRISKTNINSQVLIIAEAMAPSQVRLSGVNYFFKNGTVGSTGKNLERFLSQIDCTVYPNKPNCIYHTEIVHNFPGYVTLNGKKTIQKPTSQEITKSLKTGILEREIEAIGPKVILLMGNTAYKAFYKYFLHINPTNNLTDEILNISTTYRYQKYKKIPIIPIQHASGANPRFNQMLRNRRLIETLKKILN
jgi:uracil-DNA glycosylase